MHEKMAKAMKGKEKLSENSKKAKTSVIEAMRDMASKAMGDKLHGLKKVTVAAPDEEGLSKGLETAHELVGKMPEQESEEGEESAEHEASETPEEESAEHEEPTTPEEIEAKIAELKQKLEEAKAQQA